MNNPTPSTQRALEPVEPGVVMPSLRTGGALPDDIAQRSVTRLAEVTGALSVMLVIFLFLRMIPHAMGWDPNPGRDPITRAVVLFLVLATGMVASLARRRRMSDRRLLQLGAVWEVCSCLGAAAIDRLQFDFGTVPIPFSMSLGFFLIVPVIVPQPPRRRFLTTAACFAALPIGNALGGIFSTPVVDWGLWCFSYLPTWVFATAGLITWRNVHRLNIELSNAKDMGSYQLIERIGAGGMGEVWRARHRLLRRPAAVKLIRPDRLGGHAEEIIARFEREARVTASLRSPHTLELYDFGRREEGTFYLVSELLEGFDLARLVDREGRLGSPRTLHILAQAAASLAEAHRHGLVHRDIKPANLFLCAMGGAYDFVKVLDFGMVTDLSETSLAKETAPVPVERDLEMLPERGHRSSQLTEVGTVRGTPAYLAPEGALGKPVDARADIYGLGCLATCLLTGHPPFEYKDVDQLLRAHVLETPPPLPDEGPDAVPGGLRDLIGRCLAKEPNDRPASAEALAQELSLLQAVHPWSAAEARAWWHGAGAEERPHPSPASEEEEAVTVGPKSHPETPDRLALDPTMRVR